MKLNILTLTLFISVLGFSQIPPGYYNTATGSGYTLKTQLHNIIDNHNSQSYADLWNLYNDTDIDPNDGYIWDMYSENPSGVDPYNHTFSTDQCGNYNSENDCYNREHSFPKSWFNDASPMFSDIFHVVPTDGYVNGQRGNFPYGEVSSASWTSMNGSKRGSARAGLGYNGTVFEPIDEYKGDFARIYFYMATRYEDVISSWPGSVMLDGSSNKVFTTWSLDMLKTWHTNDPVSQKEIDRNNYIYYNIQGNRNPYVDNQNYVFDVWGGGGGVIYCQNTINESICAGESILFGGITISTAGQYKDTISGPSCDTVKTLILTVNNNITNNLPDINICSGQSAMIFGNNETVAGNYQQTFTSNITGCDSIVNVILNVSSQINVNTNISTCNSPFLFGSQSLTNSGNYIETFNAAGGCDSIVNLSLTIGSINTNVAQQGNVLQVEANGMDYQWLDCQNEYQPLQGENSQVFTSDTRGLYAVEISNGLCVDTSTCYQFVDPDIPSSIMNEINKSTVLSPNPGKDFIKIKTPIYSPKIEIRDILGNLVLTSNETKIDINNLISGLYIVIVQNDNYSIQKKLIIE